ncbi:MAG: response regulator transcription factor [Lachnospiraceae bacterium]|nr:response regulator transcription factor [Lachnospiraceae bacterium]
MEKILVVDDEKEIVELIEIYMVGDGYQVFKAFSADGALSILEKEDISLMIADIMMPGMNGIDLCKRVRETKNIPIIFLSAKTSELDKIVGLGAGADDYLTKPFSPLELSARVKSQLRRFRTLNPANAVEADPDSVELTNLKIEKKSRRVWAYGEEIKLTPTEFEILYLLAAHPGTVYSTEDIFTSIWNEKAFEANNTVMVHVRRLRTKLKEDEHEEKLISTVWGVGYKIEG